MVRLFRWAILPVYAIVSVIAVLPGLPASLGLALTGLQVEAIVVCALVVLGVGSAWFLMVEPGRETASA